MQIPYIAHGDDVVARNSIEYLSRLGFETRLIADGEVSQKAAVALFGTDATLRNKFLRVGCHRLHSEGIQVPEWASDLPFATAICRPAAAKDPSGLKVALRQLSKQYADWGPWMKCPDAPWVPRWQGEPHVDFPAWQERARHVGNAVPCLEKLLYRLTPVFKPNGGSEIKKLIVTGCALFNQPHTDVIASIPYAKRESVLDALEQVIHDAGVEDVSFVVPRGDLLRPELLDHFHPFMFMSLEEVGKYLGRNPASLPRIVKEHTHARSNEEVAVALEASGDGLVREIVDPLRQRTGVSIREIVWGDYIGAHLEDALQLAQKHRGRAEAIYHERVKTRPSYASLHAIDPERGLKRTLSNNAFYLAEGLFLGANRDTAVINCEYADTFWKGLEEVLAQEVWDDFRPFIGMAPLSARQPWGY